MRERVCNGLHVRVLVCKIARRKVVQRVNDDAIRVGRFNGRLQSPLGSPASLNATRYLSSVSIVWNDDPFCEARPVFAKPRFYFGKVHASTGDCCFQSGELLSAQIFPAVSNSNNLRPDTTHATILHTQAAFACSTRAGHNVSDCPLARSRSPKIMSLSSNSIPINSSGERSVKIRWLAFSAPLFPSPAGFGAHQHSPSKYKSLSFMCGSK